MKIKAFPLKKCFSVPIKPPAKSELSIIASYAKSIVSAATAFVYMPLTPKKKNLHFILRSLQTDRQGLISQNPNYSIFTERGFPQFLIERERENQSIGKDVKTSPNIYKYKFTRIYFLNINKEIIFGYNKVKYIPLHKKQLKLYDSRFHQ